MVIRTWLPIINSKNLLCYFYLYVWHECSCVGIVCACRGQRSIWGIIVYCSLPETCWLAWLTGLWGCRCTLPCPASQLTRESVHSAERRCLHLAGWTTGQNKRERGGRWNRASFSPLWFAVRWRVSAATFTRHHDVLDGASKLDGAFWRPEPRHPFSLLSCYHLASGVRAEKTNTLWFNLRHVDYLLESRYCAVSWWGKPE